MTTTTSSRKGKRITYAVHQFDGIVISRVGNELAWPILDYQAIGEGGDFTKPFKYNLEKMPVLRTSTYDWSRLHWTKKIPVPLKNLHRAFWGMPPLKVPAATPLFEETATP